MSTKTPAYIEARFTLHSHFENKVTHYFNNINKIKLSEFDSIIVETKRGLELAIVQSTFESKKDLPQDNFFASATIDESVVEKIKSKEVTLLLKSQRIKTLKRKMKERGGKMNEIQLLETLAKGSPEMAAMFEQIEELSK